MIRLNFCPGTHGHFLEYVINVYIMQTEPSKNNIFNPPTYSAHNTDANYQKNRQVICEHYSRYGTIYPDEKIIQINLDVNSDIFFVAASNLIYKAGDVGFNKQLLSFPDHVRNDPVAFRNNWYSKFNQRHLYFDVYQNFLPIPNPIYNFSFNSFFCFTAFCNELAKIATFLIRIFFVDHTLYDLWKQFISYNQGWQSYVKCNQIIENIFSNESVDIDCTIIEQGWLNYKIANITTLYDGRLFDSMQYPTNTKLIYAEISNYLHKRIYPTDL